MSKTPYVPNRLRGVLGDPNEDNSSTRVPSSSSSSRQKSARKSRPWRVDAQSWKQQLAERKKVYDNFALPETTNEDEQNVHEDPRRKNNTRPSSTSTTVSNPSFDHGEQIEIVLATPSPPKRTIATATAISASASRQVSMTRTNSNIDESCGSPRQKKSYNSSSAVVVAVASPISPRKASPLPRNRYTTARIIGTGTSTMDVGNIEKGISRSKAKVKLLRYEDNCDEDQSIGIDNSPTCSAKNTIMEAVEDFIDPSNIRNITETEIIHRTNTSKSSVFRYVAAAEERNNNRTTNDDCDDYDRNGIITARSSSSNRCYSNIDGVGPNVRPARRRGRRRPRSTTTSPANSATSTTATVMGPHPPYNTSLSKFDSTAIRRISMNGENSNDNNNNTTDKYDKDDKDTKSSDTDYSEIQAGSICGDEDDHDDDDDDNWSIQPVPSDEEMCLQRRRWPLRRDNDCTKEKSAVDNFTKVSGIVFVPSEFKKDNESDRTCNNNDVEKEYSNVKTARLISQSKMNGHNDDKTVRDNDPRAIETLDSPDPLQRARKTLLMSNLNRSARNLNDLSADENASTKGIFVPLRPPADKSNYPQVNSNHQMNEKCDNLNLLNDHGVYVSQYNEYNVFVPPTDFPTAALEEKQHNFVSQYNEHGAFVPDDKTRPSPSDLMKNQMSKTPVNLMELQHDSNSLLIRTLPSNVDVERNDISGNGINSDITAKLLRNKSSSPSSPPEEKDCIGKNNADSNTQDSKDSKVLISMPSSSIVIEEYNCIKNHDSENDSVSAEGLQRISHPSNSSIVNEEKPFKVVNDQSCVKALSENDENNHREEDGSCCITVQAAAPSAENAQIDILSYTDADDNLLANILDAPDTIFAEVGWEINDKTNDQNDNAVDKIDAAKIKVISDIKRHVNLINIGHHCLETVGTSTDLDPLSTKRAYVKRKLEEEKSSRSSVEFETQLNKTVSSINTDHHYVVVSPGELKPTKGKKWKDRMAIKKAAKRNSDQGGGTTRTSNININDTISQKKDSYETPSVVCKTEEKEHDIRLETNIALPEIEELVYVTENVIENTSTVDGDFGESKDGRGTEKSLEIESGNKSLTEKESPETKNGAYNVQTFSSAYEGNNSTGFIGACDDKGLGAKFGLYSEENNEIIQGLPPNEGKKRKDRLKQSKNRKIETSGSARTNEDTNIVEDIDIDGQNKTELQSSQNERPDFDRGISDLSTPLEDQDFLSPKNDDEVCESEQNVHLGNLGSKKLNKWKNRLAKIRSVPKLATPDRTECDDQQTKEKKDSLINVSKSSTLSLVAKEQQQSPEVDKTDEEMVPVQSETNTNNFDLDENAFNINNNLHQSFTKFDAFLKERPIEIVHDDDESLYTEMTIGQELMLESTVDIAPTRHHEEDQSYMDFTIEESIQPAPLNQSTVPTNPVNNQLMSPFVSNLLNSRMFQDFVPTIPTKAMHQEQKEENKLAENISEKTKCFPTITIGKCFDDDMTQITMDHISIENDNLYLDIGAEEEEFVDSVSENITRSSSLRSLSKKSRRSLNSRRSESASSFSSQLSCPETSKQRIVEILRKEVWSCDLNLVRKAMEELANEVKNGSFHRAHIVRCGGIMTVIRTMEMNASCESIQIPCLLTLEKLASDPETQVTVCEMDGVSLILRCMKNHEENAQLQEVATSALATICRQQEVDTLQDPFKNAEGAVSTLLSCMTRYAANSRIQAKAFAAIAHLCTGNNHRLAELSKAGGIMTLTMALQSPWEYKNDQHEAISNLSILLRGLTELNEKSLSPSTEHDGISDTSSETESVTTRLDDSAEKIQKDTKTLEVQVYGGNVPADDDDRSQSSYTYMDEIEFTSYELRNGKI